MFVDCILTGVVIATIMWYWTNRYMVAMATPGRNQDVEWGFTFDVHLNAFFPVLIILHFAQLLFINPVILKGGFFGVLLGNTFWLIALGYYCYVTFLGYSVLPYVKKSTLMLSPMILLVVVYLFSVIFQWNITAGLIWFYENRV